MTPIMNEKFSMGDTFIGIINSAKFIVIKVGKEPQYYGTESGNLYQNQEVYVSFRDTRTGRISQTNLKTAQRLLLRREYS